MRQEPGKARLNFDGMQGAAGAKGLAGGRQHGAAGDQIILRVGEGADDAGGGEFVDIEGNVTGVGFDQFQAHFGGVCPRAGLCQCLGAVVEAHDDGAWRGLGEGDGQGTTAAGGIEDDVMAAGSDVFDQGCAPAAVGFLKRTQGLTKAGGDAVGEGGGDGTLSGHGRRVFDAGQKRN